LSYGALASFCDIIEYQSHTTISRARGLGGRFSCEVIDLNVKGASRGLDLLSTSRAALFMYCALHPRRDSKKGASI